MRPGEIVPLAAVLGLIAACAPALREPPPVADLGQAPARSPIETPRASEVDRVLREADTSYARRPDAAAVGRALDLYLAAARADEARIEGLLGAAEASAWLIEHESDAARREARREVGRHGETAEPGVRHDDRDVGLRPGNLRKGGGSHGGRGTGRGGWRGEERGEEGRSQQSQERLFHREPSLPRGRSS